MPQSPFGPAGTNFTVDAAANAIRFTREFAAPAQDVFTAWTEPEEVELWWDPSGERLSKCEIDLRVGGTFLFVSRGHDDMPFAGVYREISAPGRIVFDALGAAGRVTLQPSERGTRMTVEIICSSPEHLEQFVKMGVAQGTSQTLDNLVSHVDRGVARAA